MLTTTTTALASTTYLAQDTGGAQGFITDNIVPLLILVVGAGVLMLALKQNMAKAVGSIAVVLIAGVVLAFAAPGVLPGVGTWALGMFGIG